MPTSTIARAFLAALQEASVAASTLVPAALRPQFVLIGSRALLYHGGRRSANDLDFVGTAAAHEAFLTGARGNRRFSLMMDGVFIQYTASFGAGANITVSIDLVELGGEAVPGLKYEPIAFGKWFVASLPELWRMKARAFVVTRRGRKMTTSTTLFGLLSKWRAHLLSMIPSSYWIRFSASLEKEALT